jgi:hypothetical protein
MAADSEPTLLGAFIRAQRQMANLSLRQLSALTEVSNADCTSRPYAFFGRSPTL